MPTHVWYFDKPTIGYCRKCDTTETIYDTGVGMRCSQCKTDDLSYFSWNDLSPHPEDEPNE
jgi:hypothetical protein